MSLQHSHPKAYFGSHLFHPPSAVHATANAGHAPERRHYRRIAGLGNSQTGQRIAKRASLSERRRSAGRAGQAAPKAPRRRRRLSPLRVSDRTIARSPTRGAALARRPAHAHARARPNPESAQPVRACACTRTAPHSNGGDESRLEHEPPRPVAGAPAWSPRRSQPVDAVAGGWNFRPRDRRLAPACPPRQPSAWPPTSWRSAAVGASPIPWGGATTPRPGGCSTGPTPSLASAEGGGVGRVGGE